jgi:DNA-binding response OmpR family regulator
MSGDTPIVLVVEDERDLAELYATWLSSAYDVRTARDGRAALEQLDDDVRVVLLDRRMPDLSGDEVLDAIRDRELDCRVAMVTAVEPDVGVVEMRFDDYLVKPVSKEELDRTVSNLLIRNEYDDGVQELFALASKKALLESEQDHTALEGADEYQRLLSDIDELRTELDDKLAQLAETEDLAMIYQDLDRDDD